MKKIAIIILLSLVLVVQYSAAQNVPSLLSANESAAFSKLLAQVASKTESISSDFSQEKSIPMLKNKIVSQGVFVYKRDDKIAFLYKSPFDYQMIINGNKLRMVSGGSDRTMDLKNNPVMGEVRTLISASFLGTLSERDRSYTTEYYSSNKKVIVAVTPLSSQLLSIIKKITITFDSQNAQIERLLIEEGSGGYTEYIFTNLKKNILLSDEIFRVN
jgi:outer membrane lipoprotein-sorting protein